MTTTKLKSKLTFEEFITQLPDEEYRYELIDGEIVRILPTRQHETIAEYITDLFKEEVKRASLNYWVSGRIVIKTITENGKEQGRHPDVSVVNKTLWESYPTSYAALIDPPQLAVEVVSTNWEDDYVDKFAEYQRFGIAEYWIVDYLAVASRYYLGNPKEPTIFVCILDDQGTYKMNAYRGDDEIISPTFSELKVTAKHIFCA
ncbi:Uma2 family endonuclease [Crocosphaera sp. UHCC 0190]|uniref:Uma2 family endonuclease n=1 Tax=Crocosphaera sp. UHCC 0190 TaxID=3110246 RepID=UPI002B221422|nr:Uma2 family endonuclease [Crocosphaera sp. UHCC 0190]MEA5509597.1 Uma2 family endonuclease [Crocosphaera sp. UHCC 0190]